MAAESVGQIGLDLVVNQGTFDKQMAGLQSTAKKAGLALAAAFSVKKLADFGPTGSPERSRCNLPTDAETYQCICSKIRGILRPI